MHEQENNQVELPNADNQEELPNTEALNEELPSAEELNEELQNNEDGFGEEEPTEIEVGRTEREPQGDGLFGIMQELVKTIELLFKKVTELSEARKLLAETMQQKSEAEQQLSQVKTELVDAKDEISFLRKKNDKLNSENVKLHGRIISDSSLRNDDKAVKYYTGLLSYEMLKCIFDFVTVGLPNGFFTCTCNPFEQYIMILMKLRLYIGDQDLAYRFGIHQSTVSRYFNKWLDVLYKNCQCLCVGQKETS